MCKHWIWLLFCSVARRCAGRGGGWREQESYLDAHETGASTIFYTARQNVEIGCVCIFICVHSSSRSRSCRRCAPVWTCPRLCCLLSSWSLAPFSTNCPTTTTTPTYCLSQCFFQRRFAYFVRLEVASFLRTPWTACLQPWACHRAWPTSTCLELVPC